MTEVFSMFPPGHPYQVCVFFMNWIVRICFFVKQHNLWLNHFLSPFLEPKKKKNARYDHLQRWPKNYKHQCSPSYGYQVEVLFYNDISLRSF